MKIKKIIDYETGENCYILYKNNKCIIIDPGKSYLKIKEFLEKESLSPKKILLTHCHYDHAADTERLKKSFGTIAAASEECAKNIKDPSVNVSVLFGEKMEDVTIDEILKDGEEIIFEDKKIKVLKTPGHTDGSVCYIADDIIFSGDTLFLSSVGRWDLPTGSFSELENSIKNKLYTLENMRVMPGHGEETSVDIEKRTNGII